MTVKVRISTEKLADRLGLSNGRAQRALGEAVRRRCDRYVPMDTGLLKNTARLAPDGTRIVYVQPYAARQFYGDYHHRDPLRGKYWHQRMLLRERDGLLSDVKLAMEEG